MKPEPLDYASFQFPNKRKWSSRQWIYAILFAVSVLIVAGCVTITIAILNGPWPGLIIYMFWPLVLVATVFLVLAILAAFKFVRAKRENRPKFSI